MVFIPTYLYIKQHSITGKLYFGKTTRDPLKYKGSGKHWLRHIKIHGKSYVVTLWHQLYDNVFDLVADALSMSNTFNIIDSNSWLNLKDETGLDGGNFGIKYIGKENGMYGKSHSIESKSIMSAKQIGVNNNFYGKSHSESSKSKISIGNIGKVVSYESKLKMSKAKTKFKYDIQTPDGYTLYNITLNELASQYNLNLQSIRKIIGKLIPYKGFIPLRKISI